MRWTRSLPALFAPILMFIATAPAQAAPVRWDLRDVTLSDGGIASGFFWYDPQFSGTFSNLMVSTTTGTAASGETYASIELGSGFGGVGRLTLLTNDQPGVIGEQALLLYFEPNSLPLISSMVNPSGELTIVNPVIGFGSGEFICNFEPTCLSQTSVQLRAVTGGNLVVSVVPLPGTLLMLGTACAAVSLRARRRRAG